MGRRAPRFGSEPECGGGDSPGGDPQAEAGGKRNPRPGAADCRPAADGGKAPADFLPEREGSEFVPKAAARLRLLADFALERADGMGAEDPRVPGDGAVRPSCVEPRARGLPWKRGRRHGFFGTRGGRGR